MKDEYLVDSINTKSGDIITFYITILSNRLWYKITQDSMYSSFSYYDGDSLERAKSIYCELLLAFNGVKAAENFNKRNLSGEINKIYNINEEYEKENLTFQQLKSDPLFLGVNDF